MDQNFDPNSSNSQQSNEQSQSHWQNQQASSQQQAQNPYAAPSLESMKDSELNQVNNGHFGLLLEPRQNDAGRGLVWLTGAWSIFKENWLMWIVSSIVLMIVFLVMYFIPFGSVLAFHLSAGFIVCCANQEEGQGLEIGSLFSVFSTHFVPVLLMSLIYMGMMIVIMIPLVILFVVGVIISGGSDADPLFILLIFLVGMALFVPLLMAVYHAPALIVLHDVEPLESIKMSFKGCLKNMMPFLIYGLVTMVIFPLILIFTVGIGFFAIYPIAMITYYTSYRDIWSERMVGE